MVFHTTYKVDGHICGGTHFSRHLTMLTLAKVCIVVNRLGDKINISSSYVSIVSRFTASVSIPPELRVGISF